MPKPPAGRPPQRRTAGRRSAPVESAAPQLRESILTATADLLATTAFGDLSVQDILTAAGISRGSFYFYFDSKHDVLAELVRRAVAGGHAAAEPWLAESHSDESRSDESGATASRQDESRLGESRLGGSRSRAGPASEPPDKIAALRAGIRAGAHLWRANGPILRAIVENWRTDPRLTALWLEQMQTFTDATVEQIRSDPEAMKQLSNLDIYTVASTLTWLGERIYYLAALGTPPFDDEDALVETLLRIWSSTVYGR
jgi:AcrR family transcriptional regulator